MTKLGELIELAKRNNPDRSSYERASERSAEAGHYISSTGISKAVKGIKTITPALVLGLHHAFGIPVEEVVRAAVADLGFPLQEYSPSAWIAIGRDTELSIEARSMLLAALRAAKGRSAVDKPEFGWGTLGGEADADRA